MSPLKGVPDGEPLFAVGARVGVLGHGVGVVRALAWRDGFEYVVLIEGGARVRVAESLLRPAHPADCQHPCCQLPF